MDSKRDHFGPSELHDAMECPVCLVLYERPLTLSCGHTVCTRCVDGLVESAEQRNQEGPFDERMVVHWMERPRQHGRDNFAINRPFHRDRRHEENEVAAANNQAGGAVAMHMQHQAAAAAAGGGGQAPVPPPHHAMAGPPPVGLAAAAPAAGMHDAMQMHPMGGFMAPLAMAGPQMAGQPPPYHHPAPAAHNQHPMAHQNVHWDFRYVPGPQARMQPRYNYRAMMMPMRGMIEMRRPPLPQPVSTVIRCPECRQPTTIPPEGLPVNYRLQDLMERVKAKAEPPPIGCVCQECGEAVPGSVYFMCHSSSCRHIRTMCSMCGLRKHNGHDVTECRVLSEGEVAAAADCLHGQQQNAAALKQQIVDITSNIHARATSILEPVGNTLNLLAQMSDELSRKERFTSDACSRRIRTSHKILDLLQAMGNRMHECDVEWERTMQLLISEYMEKIDSITKREDGEDEEREERATAEDRKMRNIKTEDSDVILLDEVAGGGADFDRASERHRQMKRAQREKIAKARADSRRRPFASSTRHSHRDSQYSQHPTTRRFKEEVFSSDEEFDESRVSAPRRHSAYPKTVCLDDLAVGGVEEVRTERSEGDGRGEKRVKTKRGGRYARGEEINDEDSEVAELVDEGEEEEEGEELPGSSRMAARRSLRQRQMRNPFELSDVLRRSGRVCKRIRTEKETRERDAEEARERDDERGPTYMRRGHSRHRAVRMSENAAPAAAPKPPFSNPMMAAVQNHQLFFPNGVVGALVNAPEAFAGAFAADGEEQRLPLQEDALQALANELMEGRL